MDVGWRRRLHWMLLAAVPSGLLLSTTTHLTTDLMAMPLLWVIPFAVYLATFILAFAESARGFVAHAVRLAPPALLLLGGYSFMATGMIATLLAAAGVVLLFYVGLALHRTLARLRPPPAQLTDFYLWLSIGGMVGGLFSALVAPLLFDWAYEHPLLLVAAAALMPGRPLLPVIGRLWRDRRARPLLTAGLPILSLVVSLWASDRLLGVGSPAPLAIAVMIIGAAALLSIGRGRYFAWHFVMLMLLLGGWRTIDTSLAEGARIRSFFGIYTVRTDEARQLRELLHGTTLHGVQSLRPELETRPMSYYAPESGAGQLFAAAPEFLGPDARIGFVGLGTGTLACYALPGQHWTAYEIDPAVARIARDPRRFTYLARCRPDLDIRIGDARLTLAAAAPASFDMLAIDAFSSDAIPLHLMTAEAFDVYGRALTPDGLLLVHISNRFVDLEPVIAAIADVRGWHAKLRDYRPGETPPGVHETRSLWILLTRDKARVTEVLDIAARPGDWRSLRRRPDVEPWTDDHASLLGALK